MNYKKPILYSIQQYIAEVSITHSSFNRVGKDNLFYEHLSVKLINEEVLSLQVDRSYGYSPSFDEYTEKLEFEKLEHYYNFLNDILDFINKYYNVESYIRLSKHIDAFNKAIRKKEQEIINANQTIDLLTNHLNDNLYYWSFIDKLTSYEIDRAYDNKILELKFTDEAPVKIIGGTPGINHYANYDLLDNNMLHWIKNDINSTLKWKQKKEVPPIFQEFCELKVEEKRKADRLKIKIRHQIEREL